MNEESPPVRIVRTADGSTTLYEERHGGTYRSMHGAVREAMHVFIQQGLRHAASQKANICLLEMGFGTGLNAWLTLMEADKVGLKVDYTAYELHPLPMAVIEKLEFPSFEAADIQAFRNLHELHWIEPYKVSPCFSLRKIKADFLSTNLPTGFDLVYYDAFGPGRQPEFWQEPVAQKLWAAMAVGGILVTFCTKGDFRRALKSAGFTVERLAGPPGKREMLRAVK